MGGLPTEEAAAYLAHVARAKQATADAIETLAARLVEDRRNRVPRDPRPVTAEMVRQAVEHIGGPAPKLRAVDCGGCAPPVYIEE